MKIQTKYNENDEVWVVWENEIHQGQIGRIVVAIDGGKADIKYHLLFSGDVSPADLHESKCFPTREALIDSLRKG